MFSNNTRVDWLHSDFPERRPHALLNLDTTAEMSRPCSHFQEQPQDVGGSILVAIHRHTTASVGTEEYSMKLDVPDCSILEVLVTIPVMQLATACRVQLACSELINRYNLAYLLQFVIQTLDRTCRTLLDDASAVLVRPVTRKAATGFGERLQVWFKTCPPTLDRVKI